LSTATSNRAFAKPAKSGRKAVKTGTTSGYPPERLVYFVGTAQMRMLHISQPAKFCRITQSPQILILSQAA
jgi:hypothetical protein